MGNPGVGGTIHIGQCSYVGCLAPDWILEVPADQVEFSDSQRAVDSSSPVVGNSLAGQSRGTQEGSNLGSGNCFLPPWGRRSKVGSGNDTPTKLRTSQVLNESNQLGLKLK